jgi:hypothetical protein
LPRVIFSKRASPDYYKQVI